jgi:general secretion pathway protein G
MNGPRFSSRRTAFTLVELVVVVMILGILAAVAAPKYLGTSATATDNGIKQSLVVVRDAIELYAAYHGGNLPGSDGAPLTFKTDLDPYLRGSFPKCPVGPARNRKVKMVNGGGLISGEASPVRAWRYNYETGQFIINWNQPTISDPTVNYDQI